MRALCRPDSPWAGVLSPIAAFLHSEWPDAGPLQRTGVVVIDCSTMDVAPNAERLRTWEVPLVLLWDGPQRGALGGLLQTAHPISILAANAPFVARDLAVTLEKIRAGPLFGAAPYGQLPLRHAQKLRTTSQKRAAVREAQALAKDLGLHPRLQAGFCSLAEEFVTNALFNAPVDARGARLFSHLPRDAAVELPEGRLIELSLHGDRERLAIAVSDPYGSFLSHELRRSIQRCFGGDTREVVHRSGGAGVGLQHVVDASSHFIVNLEPGQRTEMIALIDPTPTYQAFASSPKSVSLFAR